jgi:hypothetical protein
VAAGLGLPAEDARPQHQITRFALADIDDLEAESGGCGESGLQRKPVAEAGA